MGRHASDPKLKQEILNETRFDIDRKGLPRITRMPQIYANHSRSFVQFAISLLESQAALLITPRSVLHKCMALTHVRLGPRMKHLYLKIQRSCDAA